MILAPEEAKTNTWRSAYCPSCFLLFEITSMFMYHLIWTALVTKYMEGVIAVCVTWCQRMCKFRPIFEWDNGKTGQKFFIQKTKIWSFDQLHHLYCDYKTFPFLLSLRMCQIYALSSSLFSSSLTKSNRTAVYTTCYSISYSMAVMLPTRSSV